MENFLLLSKITTDIWQVLGGIVAMILYASLLYVLFLWIQKGIWKRSQHEKFSGKSIKYFDPELNESYTPYVIETSIGVDRMFLNVVCSKGTYIRALARDIGEALQSGAHLTALERTRVGDVRLADCLTFCIAHIINVEAKCFCEVVKAI